jgi:hypothetical protein
VNPVERLGVAPRILHELGENDRAATGFLEPDVFDATADRFFAEPDRSIAGWETAAAAQARIVAVVEPAPVTRALDQPGQGHWFRRVLHGRRRIDGDAP